MREPRTWDIFCRVVDNFGDAGVCWRLARQLAAEHGARVRLWIDDLRSSAATRSPRSTRCERADGRRRRGAPLAGRAFAEATPADVVIEAFGCGLPDDYVAAMAQRVAGAAVDRARVPERRAVGRGAPRPAFAASALAARALLLLSRASSRAPAGCLREADLFARRDALRRRAARCVLALDRARAAAAGCDRRFAVRVRERAARASFCAAGKRAPRRSSPRFPKAGCSTALRGYFGVRRVSARTVLRRGRAGSARRAVPAAGALRRAAVGVRLAISCAARTASCARNGRRGPFVWQIYPQQERAHWRKLEAFLRCTRRRCRASARGALSDLMRLWNQIDAPRGHTGLRVAARTRRSSARCATTAPRGPSGSRRSASSPKIWRSSVGDKLK